MEIWNSLCNLAIAENPLADGRTATGGVKQYVIVLLPVNGAEEAIEPPAHLIRLKVPVEKFNAAPTQ